MCCITAIAATTTAVPQVWQDQAARQSAPPVRAASGPPGTVKVCAVVSLSRVPCTIARRSRRSTRTQREDAYIRPQADGRERRVDLVQPRAVVQVEHATDRWKVPVETTRQLGLAPRALVGPGTSIRA